MIQCRQRVLLLARMTSHQAKTKQISDISANIGTLLLTPANTILIPAIKQSTPVTIQIISITIRELFLINGNFSGYLEYPAAGKMRI